MEKILLPYTLEAFPASTLHSRVPFQLTQKNAFLDYIFIIAFSVSFVS